MPFYAFYASYPLSSHSLLRLPGRLLRARRGGISWSHRSTHHAQRPDNSHGRCLYMSGGYIRVSTEPPTASNREHLELISGPVKPNKLGSNSTTANPTRQDGKRTTRAGQIS